MAKRGVVIAASVLAVAAVITAVAVVILHHHKPSATSSQQQTRHVAITFHQACRATTHPKACETAFADVAKSENVSSAAVSGILRSAASFAAARLDAARTKVAESSAASGNRNLTRAAETCSELLEAAVSRLEATAAAQEIRDARAWTGAALSYEVGCMSGLNKTGADPKIVSLLNNLVNVTSDTLSMLSAYDVSGDNVGSWGPPMTERDGFWERSNKSGLGVSGLEIGGMRENVTVCGREGECDFKTVQEAVDAGPDDDVTAGRRYVIRIKAGLYNGTVRVGFKKRNVVFLGDGMGKTVITGSANVGQTGMTTYDSATVGVLGDGFIAKDLTIENTAGPDAHQAVAFRSDSDRSIIENCEFIGNQDTLCANTLRQLYKGCRIQGNVDFIFGFAAAVFQDCTILISPRNLSPDNNVITAHGRFDPAQTTGFVFLNCTVNGTEEYMELYNKSPNNCVNYLGRPWKAYSRTVFIQCNFGKIITPAGWMPWDGDFGLSTLYYAEYNNSGPGSDLSKREKWSSKIPADHIHTYSVQNFIQGDKWIPMASS